LVGFSPGWTHYHPSVFWPVVVWLAVPTEAFGIPGQFGTCLCWFWLLEGLVLLVIALAGSVGLFVGLFGFLLCHLVSLILGAGWPLFWTHLLALCWRTCCWHSLWPSPGHWSLAVHPAHCWEYSAMYVLPVPKIYGPARLSCQD